MSGSAVREDELGSGIEGDLRGAADDEVGMFPGPLAGHERHLLGHPVAVVPRGQRPAWLPHAGQAAALGFPLVGLDPDRCVDKAGGFAAGRPDALDDEQGAASWDLDRPPGAGAGPTGEGGRSPAARRALEARRRRSAGRPTRTGSATRRCRRYARQPIPPRRPAAVPPVWSCRWSCARPRQARQDGDRRRCPGRAASRWRRQRSATQHATARLRAHRGKLQRHGDQPLAELEAEAMVVPPGDGGLGGEAGLAQDG
jgi:hypothetical protein